MKRRSLLGLIVTIAAIVVVFVISPFWNTVTTQTTEVLRLSRNVTRGTKITVDHLEVVEMNPDAIPIGIINDVKSIVGKYAAAQLYAGDYITPAKLTTDTNTAADAFADLDGKYAISIPLGSFAGSLSGKLQNGDIVRFYIRDAQNATAYTPASLQWVKIVTTTTGSGIDQDKIIVNADGSHSMPSTVTILATERQAKDLVYFSNSSIHLALVFRGDPVEAKKYLEMQDEELKRLEEEEADQGFSDDFNIIDFGEYIYEDYEDVINDYEYSDFTG